MKLPRAEVESTAARQSGRVNAGLHAQTTAARSFHAHSGRCYGTVGLEHLCNM